MSLSLRQISDLMGMQDIDLGVHARDALLLYASQVALRLANLSVACFLSPQLAMALGCYSSDTKISTWRAVTEAQALRSLLQQSQVRKQSEAPTTSC